MGQFGGIEREPADEEVNELTFLEPTKPNLFQTISTEVGVRILRISCFDHVGGLYGRRNIIFLHMGADILHAYHCKLCVP